MTSSRTFDALLALTRLGIGHDAAALPDSFDWPALESPAAEQGLSAVVLDGIEALRTGFPGVSLPEKNVLVPWAGEVVQDYECRYEAYRRAIGSLAGFYGEHGFMMMVLKGFACSLDWPRPDHRPCGDIDIWQFGRQAEADESLRRAQGPEFEIGTAHHHHTEFSWQDFLVENHYDFLNVHYGHRNAALEEVLKGLAEDDSWFVDVDGQRVYLPSPNLHALFLLRHVQLHFASTGMNLRQLLDWGFFVEKNRDRVDWPWFVGVCNEFYLTRFLGCLNALCIEALGFDEVLFSGMPCLGPEKDRVLNDMLGKDKGRVLADMLEKEFVGDAPSGFFPRVWFKYRRWRAQSWKRKLCYGDSDLVSFFVLVWGHLVKPGMI